MIIKRRQFLQGCCAGIAAMSGSSLGRLVFAANPSSAGNRDIVISLFLRGGMDSLSFLVPHADPNYHIARTQLAFDTNQVLDVNGYFGLHPSAPELKELMDSGHMAMIPACGSPHPTRSHFEAQDYMELGTPGTQYASTGGWLARHLSMFPADNEIFRAVTSGSSLDVALEGLQGALALSGANGFTLQGDSDHKDDMRRALREMYNNDDRLREVAISTLDAIDIIDRSDPNTYTPGHGVTYPNTGLGRSMASVAQMIRLDLGLQAATVNYGGWDTHEYQANSYNITTGSFAGLVGTLSQALSAFWNDLADYHGRVTVVVMSEFGRRLKENNNYGTDHGHAGMMMVMSGSLAQAGVVGPWPGLASGQLFENVDVEVMTDYRNVLSEVLYTRGGNTNPGEVFPGFTYQPMGLFPVEASVNRDTLNGFMKMYR